MKQEEGEARTRRGVHKTSHMNPGGTKASRERVIKDREREREIKETIKVNYNKND